MSFYSDIIYRATKDTIYRLGESVQITLNGVVYPCVKAVVTDVNSEELHMGQMDSIRNEYYARNFEFVLPHDAARPVRTDTILYNVDHLTPETFMITKITKGYRNIFQVFAVNDRVVNIGNDDILGR